MVADAAPRATGLAARFVRYTLAALGERGVLLGIVFYVDSSVRQLRCEGVLMSVGLREDFGGC